MDSELLLIACTEHGKFSVDPLFILTKPTELDKLFSFLKFEVLMLDLDLKSRDLIIPSR